MRYPEARGMEDRRGYSFEAVRAKVISIILRAWRAGSARIPHVEFPLGFREREGSQAIRFGTEAKGVFCQLSRDQDGSYFLYASVCCNDGERKEMDKRFQRLIDVNVLSSKKDYLQAMRIRLGMEQDGHEFNTLFTMGPNGIKETRGRDGGKRV